ncbi:hypothetical protein ARTSIC4J27_2715 [Pseudarthrobacter siccitolerans]|uniref:Uncharacterized protein n=1 Tax=Pseudarthrobacter siccitolerans TaxID=861266 RepID=A0A024H3Z4_9MICC|nr:hypothetical protein ARTSIC4J27_2715 [Pseudarthrobacter siccitolerans]
MLLWDPPANREGPQLPEQSKASKTGYACQRALHVRRRRKPETRTNQVPGNLAFHGTSGTAADAGGRELRLQTACHSTEKSPHNAGAAGNLDRFLNNL